MRQSSDLVHNVISVDCPAPGAVLLRATMPLNDVSWHLAYCTQGCDQRSKRVLVKEYPLCIYPLSGYPHYARLRSVSEKPWGMEPVRRIGVQGLKNEDLMLKEVSSGFLPSTQGLYENGLATCGHRTKPSGAITRPRWISRRSLDDPHLESRGDPGSRCLKLSLWDGGIVELFRTFNLVSHLGKSGAACSTGDRGQTALVPSLFQTRRSHAWSTVDSSVTR